MSFPRTILLCAAAWALAACDGGANPALTADRATPDFWFCSDSEDCGPEPPVARGDSAEMTSDTTMYAYGRAYSGFKLNYEPWSYGFTQPRLWAGNQHMQNIESSFVDATFLQYRGCKNGVVISSARKRAHFYGTPADGFVDHWTRRVDGYQAHEYEVSAEHYFYPVGSTQMPGGTVYTTWWRRCVDFWP